MKDLKPLRTAVAALALLAGLTATTWAQMPNSETPPEKRQGVGIDQNLDAALPLDLEFVDEEGRPVKLGAYFRQKPVILAMVYYECPMLCTLVLNGLLRGLSPLQFSAGEEFDVVAVSIDPGETAALAKAKRAEYVKLYDRESGGRGWHFLTGDEENIRKLAEVVGFNYRYDSETDLYIHASGLMMATPEGRLSRYFYGIEYPPRDLRLALVESSQGKIGSPVDQLLLYCFSYDPTLGKYTMVVMNVLRLGGILTILAVAAFIIVSYRRDRRRHNAEAAAG
ncbi:MAG TPA: SCO family protein [Acidobacteriota bacterium]|nr:SCO family protein [Acidobacteriota bacterium]